MIAIWLKLPLHSSSSWLALPAISILTTFFEVMVRVHLLRTSLYIVVVLLKSLRLLFLMRIC